MFKLPIGGATTGKNCRRSAPDELGIELLMTHSDLQIQPVSKRELIQTSKRESVTGSTLKRSATIRNSRQLAKRGAVKIEGITAVDAIRRGALILLSRKCCSADNDGNENVASIPYTS